jgi:hypothetical protein
MGIKVAGIMIVSSAEFRLHRHKRRKSQGVISKEIWRLAQEAWGIILKRYLVDLEAS